MASMGIRISKRDLLARTIDLTGCGRILRAATAWRGVLILNYHRIGNKQASLLDRNLWSATTEDFDAQLAAISRDFQVIGLNDLDSALREKRGRFVMITFDDGYLDNYTNAFPALKAHGIPATFFITTGFLDVPMVPWWDEIAWMVRTSPLDALDVNPWTTTPVPFDQPHREIAINRLLAVYKTLPGSQTQEFINFLAGALGSGRCPVQVAEELWMTWDMIREMKQHGMSFGGHTVNHPILANVSREQQDFEIGACRRRLIEELGEPIKAFSYPVGGQKSFNTDTRELLVKYGFQWAFTFIRGYCRQGNQDRLTIPRTAIETDIDLAHFRAITTLPQVFA
jgi:peptidoglycan/xylan/chitin deacetylase (PgdA/CDA1 family)